MSARCFFALIPLFLPICFATPTTDEAPTTLLKAKAISAVWNKESKAVYLDFIQTKPFVGRTQNARHHSPEPFV